MVAIASVINSAKSGDTVTVPAGVHTGTFSIPAGVTVVGAGKTSSHLKGKVTYGSGVTVRDCKLGDAGYSVRPAPQCTNSTFLRCRFRGGGGKSSDAPVLLFGFSSGHLASHISFISSDIECNLGVEDTAFARGYDNVYIQEHAVVGGAHVEYLTFDGCRFGVSNGVRKGCPRMDFEAYTVAAPTLHNWNDLTIKNCTFEKADWYNIDLSSAYKAGTTNQATGANLISGCTLGGAGRYSLCIEYPQGVIFENNTVRRGGTNTVKWGRGSMANLPVGAIIRNNVFDLDYNNGIGQGGAVPMFYVKGDGNKITGNIIKAASWKYDKPVFTFETAKDNVCTGNTITLSTNNYLGSSGNAANYYSLDGSSTGLVIQNSVTRV